MRGLTVLEEPHLALHALTTDGWLSAAEIDAALALVLDGFLDHGPDPR